MTDLLRPSDFHTEFVSVNGIRMHVALEGEPGAPLVVLLHGFPEFWYSWRHQIRALTAAGYRVVAPDQRGYNLTDKQGPYDVFQLSGDVAALIRALGYDKAAAVIGHDWGGVVTWVFGALYPELLDKLIVCNVPHPKTSENVLQSFYFPQIAKSWYMYFFQLPGIPERSLAQDNYKGLAVQLRKDAHKSITRDEIAYFQEAWAQPGAMEGGINWYRAFFRSAGKLRKTNLQVHTPSLLIWGEDDSYLTKQMAEWTRAYVDTLRVEYLPGISHWVQQEAPERVNTLILGFLTPLPADPLSVNDKETARGD